jgi:hypothetical protein
VIFLKATHVMRDPDKINKQKTHRKRSYEFWQNAAGKAATQVVSRASQLERRSETGDSDPCFCASVQAIFSTSEAYEAYDAC